MEILRHYVAADINILLFGLLEDSNKDKQEIQK